MRRVLLALALSVFVLSACLAPSPDPTVEVNVVRATTTRTPTRTRTPTPTRTLTPTPSPLCAAPTHAYGVMLDVSKAAGAIAVCNLNASWVRLSRAVILDDWRGACEECEAARELGLRIALTVRANAGGVPITDTLVYSSTLASVLDTIKPELLVVENEQDTLAFYAGTPSQYQPQLSIACEVAHARAIPCADGGMTYRTVALVTWDILRDMPLTDAASDFKAQVPEIESLFASDTELTPAGNARLTKAWQLVEAARGAGIDYANMHWYGESAESLETTLRALALAYDLPVIVNEIGDRTGIAGNVTNALESLQLLHVPIAIWFSPLDDTPYLAKSLIDPNGESRSTGNAYADFTHSLP